MKYRPRLDGLRCIAILMVLLGHFLYFLGGTNSGIYGVNLFFVLSGFLITSILLTEKGNKFSVSYKKFIGRRALRIFPVYYLIVLFYVLIKVDGIALDWPYLLTYTYNFKVSGMADWEQYLYAPYWSLSVEEQFYLFFPFVILLLNKQHKLQLIVFLLIVLIAFSERIFHFTNIHRYVNIITNMGALTIGAIGAWFVKYSRLDKRIFNSILVEISVLLLFALTFRQGENIIGFIFYPLINIYLVIKASVFSFKIKPIDKFLTNKWSILIGRISYGIYLYHIMVRHFFDLYIFKPLWSMIPFESLGYFSKLQYNESLIKFPFIALLTVLIAFLSFRFIEAPFLKLKDKYFRNTQKKTNLVAISHN